MTTTSTDPGTTQAGRASRLGARRWAVLALVGLVGQIAWTVENMYLNVFVYDTITDDPAVGAGQGGAGAAGAPRGPRRVGAGCARVGRRPLLG
ncbi:MFS transporter, partial [Agromyces sp. NPDC056965]